MKDFETTESFKPGVITPDMPLVRPIAETTNLPSVISSGDTSLSLMSLPAEIETQVRDLIRTTKIGEARGMEVLQKFAVGFEPFLRLKAEAESIIVTDPSQIELIARAKDIDTELLAADKHLAEIHAVEKEYYLRPGQMVDGCRRIPSNAIAKVREHLKKQFDYVRLLEKERVDKIIAARREQLAQYNAADKFVVGLGTIDDDQFGLILSGAKAQFEEDEKNAAISRAEAERIQTENARLRAEAAQKQADEARRVGRINRLSEIGMVFDGVNYSYEELNFNNFSLNDDSDAGFEGDFAVIAPEVRRRVAARAEQARVDAENARIAQAQLDELNRQKAAEAERARLAALAPDKDKIVQYFQAVHNATTPLPIVESEEAKALMQRFFDDVSNLVNRYAAEAAKLGGMDTPF